MRAPTFVLLLVLTACTRSTDPQLYTLVSAEPSRTWPSEVVVELRRPHIAGYLDRREVVRRVLAQRLELDRKAVWAEPLDELLGRTLAADLTLRLPRSQVYSELSNIRATPSVIVAVDLQRFEQGEHELVLRALVSLHGGAATPSTLDQVELRAPLRGDDTASQVAAMTQQLGELADRIAEALARRVASAPPHD